MKKTALGLIVVALLVTATTSAKASVIAYFEDFDGNTQGYNPDSTTASLGDDDWVDFMNRISNDAYGTASTGESVLAGNSSSNDPQVRADFGIGIDKTTVKEVAMRIRIDSDQNGMYDDSIAGNVDFSLFWGTDQYVHPGANNGNSQLNFNFGAPDSLVAQADGWHLATWTFAAGLSSGTGANLDSLRIDPTNGPAGNGDSFEVDYVSVSVVPEPTSLLLTLLGSVGVIMQRRR